MVAERPFQSRPIPQSHDLILSLEAHALSPQLFLDFDDVYASSGRPLAGGHCGSCAGTLTRDCATHHIAGCCVGYLVACNATPCYQEVIDADWDCTAVRHLKVTPCSWQDEHVVAVHKL